MLRFPFDERRPGQDLLMRDLRGAIETGGTLVCSAPTGIGKTAAALFPMVEAALRDDRKVFFVTAKTSQQELALRTLAMMLRDLAGPFGVQIAARERSCPRDGRTCRARACVYRAGFAERVKKHEALVGELRALAAVDAVTLSGHALEAGLCPFELSLHLAERATVVIADFNYVFDPHVYLRRFFDRKHDRWLLVVDEAHNLPERAVGYDSPEIDLVAADRLLEGLRRLPSAVRAGALDEIGAVLEEFVANARVTAARLAEERFGNAPPVEAPDRGLAERLGEQAAELAEGYLVEHPDTPAGLRGPGDDADPILDVLYRLQDFARCAQEDPDRFATLWLADRVRTLCLDPAPRLRQRFAGFHTVLCMSATLTPFAFHRRRLGLEDRAVLTLELESPFPKENRCLVSVGGIDTRFRHRDAHAGAIARLLLESARVRPGNYLAFFPSFAFRDQVVAELSRAEARELGVMLQLPGAPVEPTLRKLAKADRPHLLCAAHGGVFSEGVDYPGDMALGVFIVGPALPTVSPEQELSRSYYDRLVGEGFEYAYLHPGIRRVIQAGGRPIRTPTDRAFVMLIGDRFAEPAYREKLPAYWQRELVDVAGPEGALTLLRTFWAGRPAARGRAGRTRVER